MKKHLILLFWPLLIMMSCDNDPLADLTEQLPEKKEVTTRSSCMGPGACVPKITMHHSRGVTEVWWSIDSWKACKKYTLSCSGAGQSKQLEIQGNGNTYINHGLEKYVMSYTVRCTDPNCRNCIDQGVFTKTPEDDGTMGTHYDCKKMYPLCQAGFSSGFLAFSVMQSGDPKKTLATVTAFSIYHTKYLEAPSFVMSGSIYPNVTIPPTPLIYSDPNSSYEIRLYSNDCQEPTEHYLYGSFTGADIHRTISLNLREHKHN